MSGFQSLTRDTLSDQVADRLLSYIIAQRLEPGARLPSEKQLAVEFDVSRPVIREALRSLAGQRMIEIVNGKGAVVMPLDGYLLGLFFQRAVQLQGSFTLELMEVRRCLEVPMARMAAERRTDEDVEALRELVTKMHEPGLDSGRYVELDVAFHIALARATHNTMLYYIVSSVRTALAEVIAAVFGVQPTESALSEMRQRSQSQHQKIFDAIERRDGAGAERAMQVHLADAREAVSGGG